MTTADKLSSTWFFAPGATITGWLVSMVGGATIEGDEHVPSGPYILVANHCSLADPPIIGWAVGRRHGRVIHFMAKEEMRRWPVIGWLAQRSGVFFVRRGEGDRASQRIALDTLAAGEPIAVFPEGTRSRDGQLSEAKGGATLLAMRAGVPLLPVGIAGSQRLFPGHARIPKRSHMTIRIGQPFTLEHQPDGRLDRAALAAGTDRIMREIAALLPRGQRGRWGA
jgi:1-acyl-sn-glycerol-3-phosphate acyltransferase